MSSGSNSGSSVVERASKEISRRIHSLGFTKKSKESAKEEEKASITDKLNGNETNEEHNAQSKLSSATSGVSKMGTIIKGSVMDKVTHVFNSANMGNVNNKEQVSNIEPQIDSGELSGTNIPKGAVANGRAKFEAAMASSSQQPILSSSTEKPLRFFSSSRSRGNSPLLPVKTPKVPSFSSSNSQQSSSNISGGTPIHKRKFTAPLLGISGNAAAISTSHQREISPTSTSKLFPRMKRFIQWEEMWQDSKFLYKFFWYFSPIERHVLAQVCINWRNVLYHSKYWKDQRPVLHCRVLRNWNDNDEDTKEMKRRFYQSLIVRKFESAVLLNANDADIFDFFQNFPKSSEILKGLTLRCCSISDRGLEAIMEFLKALYQLEIVGCNEITEQGIWSSLQPRLISITIMDCINVADESICAVTQLLTSLYEFNLQAYHVTDTALGYFSPKQTNSLNIFRLQSCWEISNHGIVNIVRTLPNLTILSLSGCSKITDDGIELIAENLQKLRSLDLSWCPRVTDVGLEYIACDLNNLQDLTLDRCVHVTDIGIGYISTMAALSTLYLRWCSQITNLGLQQICGMRNMQILSLAGCPLLTSPGLVNLSKLRNLVELELTNCPGATPDLIEYLRKSLPTTLVID